jgi:hypothetical protein
MEQNCTFWDNYKRYCREQANWLIGGGTPI